MNKSCQICGVLFIKKVNESKVYWETKKYCSRKCTDAVTLWKPGNPAWNKGKKYPQVTGVLNSQWKGGITSSNEKLRKSTLYKIWKNAIFDKDNYTCQYCEKRGGNLNAHHIKPFATHPELRFALDNGITLCEPCHRKVNHRELLSPTNY